MNIKICNKKFYILNCYAIKQIVSLFGLLYKQPKNKYVFKYLQVHNALTISYCIHLIYNIHVLFP